MAYDWRRVFDGLGQQGSLCVKHAQRAVEFGHELASVRQKSQRPGTAQAIFDHGFNAIGLPLGVRGFLRLRSRWWIPGARGTRFVCANIDRHGAQLVRREFCAKGLHAEGVVAVCDGLVDGCIGPVRRARHHR